MIGPDGVDYGEGWTRAQPGKDDRNPLVETRIGGRWVVRWRNKMHADNAPDSAAFLEAPYHHRRPMTQAEKDAEIVKMPGMSSQQALVHAVRDAILKGQAKNPLTTETAAMVIEIVRAHDAKQKAGE